MFLSHPLIIILPFALYVWLFLKIDRDNKLSWKWLVASFLWGAIPATILSLITEVGAISFFHRFLPQNILIAFNYGILVPLVEEIFKGLAVLFLYLFVRREFDDWVDGIVYASMSGFGFATIEKLMQSLSTDDPQIWQTTYLMNVIAFGFAHAIYTSFIGIGFGVSRLSPRSRIKWTAPIIGLLLAVIFHGMYDVGNAYSQINNYNLWLSNFISYMIPTSIMIYLVIRTFPYRKQLLRKYLSDEVPTNITEENYFALCGKTKRKSNKFKLDRRQPKQFIKLCSKLAQRKQQFDKLGEFAKFSDEIEPLKEKIRSLQPNYKTDEY